MFCRCRPLNNWEASAGQATVVDFSAAKDGELGILTGGSTKKIFQFDRVYTPRDEQGMHLSNKVIVLLLILFINAIKDSVQLVIQQKIF